MRPRHRYSFGTGSMSFDSLWAGRWLWWQVPCVFWTLWLLRVGVIQLDVPPVDTLCGSYDAAGHGECFTSVPDPNLHGVSGGFRRGGLGLGGRGAQIHTSGAQSHAPYTKSEKKKILRDSLVRQPFREARLQASSGPHLTPLVKLL